MKKWKPIFINNSKVPVWLSKVSPINIWALSFFCFVWCRGVISGETKRHETIHFQQQLELLFVFQWLLYGLFWLHGYLKYRDGKLAYYRNPFEQEAYSHDQDSSYLEDRKRYSWTRYSI